MIAEQGDDLLGLVHAHEAVVDEDAGQLIADRLVDEDRGDRRIDPAAEAADHPLASHLRADFGDHRGCCSIPGKSGRRISGDHP